MSLTQYVPFEPLDKYRERFAEHFVLDRDERGVLEVRMHTNGGEAVWGLELHRAVGQLFEAIGADRDNQVVIITGTGEFWLRHRDAESFAAIESDPGAWRRDSYDIWFRDGRRILEKLIWDVDMPTISALNGPGFHTEFALLCDLTICTNTATFIDPHISVGLVPGDGQFLVYQELLGRKRANAIMFQGRRVDASAALELGLVNEVVTPEQLLPRAHAIADEIMKIDPLVRRTTTHLVRRPWKRVLTADLDFHFSQEVYAASVARPSNRHANALSPDPAAAAR